MFSSPQHIDPFYEFEAPQFHDFKCDSPPNVQVDDWFDSKIKIEDDSFPVLSDDAFFSNSADSNIAINESNMSPSRFSSASGKNKEIFKDQAEKKKSVMMEFSPGGKFQKNRSMEQKNEIESPKKTNDILLTFSPTSTVVEPKERKKIGKVLEFSPGCKINSKSVAKFKSTKIGGPARRCLNKSRSVHHTTIQSIEQKNEIPKKRNSVLLTYSPTRIVVEPKERKKNGNVLEFSPGCKTNSKSVVKFKNAKFSGPARRCRNKSKSMQRRTTRSMSRGLTARTRAQTSKIKSKMNKMLTKKKKRSAKPVKRTKKKRRHLTEAYSPQLSKPKPRPPMKSSIDRELEQINFGKEKFMELRALNAKAIQSSTETFSSFLPVRSTKPCTEPKEFLLYTAARASARKEAQILNKPVEKPIKTKTHHTKTWDNSLTKIEPFELHTQLRAKAKQSFTSVEKSESFVSRSKQCESFFESLRNNPMFNSNFKKTLTIPKDPKLMTSTRRSRPLPQSSEELELEKIKKFPKFKAQKYAKIQKILSNKISCPSIPKKPLTRFQEFKLSTTNTRKTLVSPPIKEFKPIKLRRKILTHDNRNQIAKLVKCKKRETTKPIGFDLSKSRKRKTSHIEPKPRQFKATAIPSRPVSKPFKRHKHSPIKVQEFKLQTELRGAVKQHMFQKEMECKEKKAKDEQVFKAQPVPDYRNKKCRKSIPKQPLTKPKPFSFMVYENEAEQQKKIDTTVVLGKEKFAQFKAQPVPVTQSKPFLVNKSMKALTIITSPALNTKIRSEHRKSFDLEVLERTKYREQQDEYVKAIEQQKEQNTIKKLRSQMVHNPVKIPDLKSPSPHRVSGALLTVAESPLLMTKLRKNARYSFRTPRNQSRYKRSLPR